jgi:glycosyltransferase involved in cell wall biosynthesis
MSSTLPKGIIALMMHMAPNTSRRVLYFAPEYYVSYGARTHAREFFRALQKHPAIQWCSVFPNAPLKSDLPSDLAPVERRFQHLKQQEPFHTVHQWARLMIPNRRLLAQLKTSIRDNRVDTLVMRLGGKFKYLGSLKREFPKLQICVELNSSIFFERQRDLTLKSFFQRLELQQFRRADCFSVVSPYWKDYLLNAEISSQRIVVNPNGVNPALFCKPTSAEKWAARRKWDIPQDAFVLGYIGGMEPFRRLPRMIELLAALNACPPPHVVTMIIGDGEDMGEVRRTIERHSNSLASRVSCFGWQPYEEIPSFTRCFDAGIFPFTAPYMCPLKLFEYMAQELPVIGPDIPGVRDWFVENHDLMISDAEGTNFAKLVRRLQHNPSQARQMGTRARQTVCAKYTWEHNAERLIRLLQETPI